MASSTLQKLLRRSNLTGAIAATLRSPKPQCQGPAPLHIIHDHVAKPGFLSDYFLGSPKTESSNWTQTQSHLIFPSFRLGLGSDTIRSNLIVEPEVEDAESGHSSTVWADSVKKKRKKKMNKHKYKKLRKRLRRQT